MWIESEDGLRLDGVVIRPLVTPVKPVAVVHVHGFTGRFSHPAHILVARALARHGYLSVSGNNRGCAFGETTHRLNSGEPVVIGGAWERFAECVHDIAPWITYTTSLGFGRVALLGQSFGGPKVVYYQAQRQDPRVVALILASPGPTRPLALAPAVVAAARRLVAAGQGRALLPWGALGNVSPSASAQTVVDWATPALYDVFGLAVEAPAVAQLRCPLLAFYGTLDEPGGPAELELIRCHARAAPRVDLRVIEGADHSYTGRGPEVGRVIAEWLDTVCTPV